MGALVDAVLIPFVVGLASSAIVVLIGVRSIKEYIREGERRRNLGLLPEFWSTPGGSKVFNVVFGAEWQGREGEIEPRFGYAQAYGVSALIDCLGAVFDTRAVVRLIVVKKTDRLSSQLFEENLVVFGGEESISQFGAISKALDVPYYQYKLDLNSRSFETPASRPPREVVCSDTKDGQLIADIGTVTRLVNPSNRRLLVLFNGNYGAGLLGGVLAVTRNGPLLEGVKSTATAQQLLVKVPDISNNIIDRTHTVEAVRGWVEFSPPAGAFQRVTSGDAGLANRGMQPTAQRSG